MYDNNDYQVRLKHLAVIQLWLYKHDFDLMLEDCGRSILFYNKESKLRIVVNRYGQLDYYEQSFSPYDDDKDLNYKSKFLQLLATLPIFDKSTTDNVNPSNYKRIKSYINDKLHDEDDYKRQEPYWNIKREAFRNVLKTLEPDSVTDSFKKKFIGYQDLAMWYQQKLHEITSSKKRLVPSNIINTVAQTYVSAYQYPDYHDVYYKPDLDKITIADFSKLKAVTYDRLNELVDQTWRK